MNPVVFIVWSKEQCQYIELIAAYTSRESAETKAKELTAIEKAKESFVFEYFVDKVGIVK